MKKNIKQIILSSIGKIYEESKDCGLQESFFTKVEDDLSILSDYFQTSKMQAFFIALAFALNQERSILSLADYTGYLKCNPMKILEYSEDFDYFFSSGILKKVKGFYDSELGETNDHFIINKKIADAVLRNEPMPEMLDEKITDIFGLLGKLYELGEQRDTENYAINRVLCQAKVLISEYSHFPLIKKISPFKLSIDDTYLYLYLIWNTMLGYKSTDIGETFEKIYNNSSERVRQVQKFLFGENALIQQNLVKIEEDHFFNDASMKLTETSNNLMKACGIKVFMSKKKKYNNIITPKETPFRELIFSKSEMEQLFLLKDLLNDLKFKRTQKRLSDKNLPKGIAVLLHGAPGTGKTEAAKQIAKATGRALMKVEISQSKSAWLGESEKIMKQIFTDYKLFAKECDRTPILLFNEADALISKRREVGRAIDQTENTIQNVILEELENFEGIFIATTNLVSNLDSAFERRFLFKIHFQKPDSSLRTKIWKSKLPLLTLKDCQTLAEKFDFSGGQIDNILRKKEIHEIVHGKKVTLTTLMTFCKEETLVNHNRVKIGYNKS